MKTLVPSMPTLQTILRAPIQLISIDNRRSTSHAGTLAREELSRVASSAVLNQYSECRITLYRTQIVRHSMTGVAFRAAHSFRTRHIG